MVASPSTIWYKFVPTQTKKYTFTSNSMLDTQATLYNADRDTLTSNDDGGYYYNFSLSYDLVAGQTYYLVVKVYSGSFLRGENYIDISIK